MSIQELERAIMRLSVKDVASLTTWLIDYHEQLWDKQIEDDLDMGRLDNLLDKIERLPRFWQSYNRLSISSSRKAIALFN